MDDFYYTVMQPQFTQEQDSADAPFLIRYKGVPLYVRPYGGRHYQIVSLCTTDPAPYLRDDLAPGTLIPIF